MTAEVYCRTCRNYIANNKDVLPCHSSAGGSGNIKHGAIYRKWKDHKTIEGNCTACDLDSKSTVIYFSTVTGIKELHEVEDRILCNKCGAKLGSYCSYGITCAQCGRWETPGLILQRKCVDIISQELKDQLVCPAQPN